MKRRETINVWPAIADLMTVLAVPSLCLAVGLYPLLPPGGEGGVVPKNERMFQAIQRAESFVEEVKVHSRLRLDPDQTLRFGDDLVGFEVGRVEPIWKAGSWDRLGRYCAAVSASLERQPEMKRRFVIFVEGHADASSCHDGPQCNWWISSSRAAKFVVAMRASKVCPAAKDWTILPVGFAATRPIDGGGPATRRIALRLMPDYKRIIQNILDRDRRPRRSAEAGRPSA